jgi:hypothetical protein
MDLRATHEDRMVTPDVVKQHAARQSAAGLYQIGQPQSNYNSKSYLQGPYSPPGHNPNNFQKNGAVADKISEIKLAYLAQGGQDLKVLEKI